MFYEIPAVEFAVIRCIRLLVDENPTCFLRIVRAIIDRPQHDMVCSTLLHLHARHESQALKGQRLKLNMLSRFFFLEGGFLVWFSVREFNRQSHCKVRRTWNSRVCGALMRSLAGMPYSWGIHGEGTTPVKLLPGFES